MSSKTSQEKINQIRDANDIVSVISNYLTLTKKGKTYFGLCPFHPEKTPSFSVSPDKQMYYCFGCGKGGDVFTFLMEHEKLTFAEAVRFLAHKAGIQIGYEKTDSAQYKEKEAMYHAVRFAANFYYLNLSSNSQGEKALNYLAQRGIAKETIKTFGLGYSPDRWDGLIRAATAKSIDTKNLLKVGLVIERERGGYYDRFRGRVMFPILDVSGRPVAFGARRIVEDNSPKYINSPEVAHFYEKRTLLYGLSQARQSIQTEDKALMVEGYMDLISLYQKGIKNVVATSGTALTAEHAKLLCRYNTNAVLLYDGDSAGSRAALRGLDVLLENDIDVQVARLPSGDDPDSFIRKYGKSALLDLIDQASPLVEFKVQMMNEMGALSTPEGKAKVIQSILESVLKIKDEIKQSVTIQEIAERFFLDDRLLLRKFEQLKKQQSRARYTSAAASKAPNDGATSAELKTRTKGDLAEETLVKLLIQNEDLESYIFAHLDIRKIRQPVFKEIIEIIHLFYQEKKLLDRAKLTSYFQNPEVSAFIAKALHESIEVIETQQVAFDCIIQIEKREITEAMKSIQFKIRDYESKGQDSSELKKKWQALMQELKKLEASIGQKNLWK